MRIVCISDTHGQHRNIQLPKGDMLIHAGDISSTGTEDQIMNFMEWFKDQEFQYKIFISGNHDFLFERKPKTARQIIPESIIYLEESSINIEGLKIYGTPVTPYFLNWAFNRQPGKDIEKHVNRIPNDVDILISHGPPHGFLDVNSAGQHCGCPSLLAKVKTAKPKLMICGHIHEGYGQAQNGETQIINASLLDDAYKYVNAPVVIDI